MNALKMFYFPNKLENTKPAATTPNLRMHIHTVKLSHIQVNHVMAEIFLQATASKPASVVHA